MSGFRLWLPPALLAGIIFVLSSMSQVPGSDYVSDKFLHLVVFGALCLLTLRATHGGLNPLLPGPAAVAFGLVLLWGVLDEVHQSFVPGRYASLWDAVADAVGAGMAVGLWAVWRGTARIPRALGGGER